MKQALDLWFINPRDQEFQEPSFHEKEIIWKCFPIGGFSEKK